MADQFVGQTIADKYRIESFLRISDNGLLFRGRHIPMDKRVTIKLLLPELIADEPSIRAFEVEARSSARLNDPNILNVTDFGTDSAGQPYIIYEDFPGTTLKDIIRGEGRLGAARAVNIAKRTAFALAAAHAHKVVHGGITSNNILVNRTSADVDRIKVYEFSAEYSAGRDDTDPGRNLAYLSPEQASGRYSADERSDIYSLGIVLYEMLAGEVPFSGDSPSAIVFKHLEEPPPPLSAFRQDLPPSLETVLIKALAKDPAARQQTAQEFAFELDRTMTDAAAAATAAPSGNNIWKTAFVVLAGIAILAAALIYATSSKQTNPTTQLATDANGQPVQPINPATGVQEESLANMQGMSAETISNSNMAVPPGTLPGGDGYNPWANGGAPPAGGPPTYIGPGGQVITIDPNSPSQFMPAEGGVILVPVPANTNTAVKPTPSPKAGADANSQPAAEPSKPAASPTPEKPAATPAAKPKPAQTPAAKPAASGKPEESL